MNTSRRSTLGVLALSLAYMMLPWAAHGGLIFVQSFEGGLTPDYTLADETPLDVQGELKTAEGWVTDAAVFGDDGLEAVTYGLASAYEESREGAVRFHYKGDPQGDFFTLSGPDETLTLSGSASELTATVVVGGEELTRSSSFDLPKKGGFVQVAWKPGTIRVGGTALDLPAPLPFAFDFVTIGSRQGTPVSGTLDEFAVYDEWQPPATGSREALTLSWIPDERVDEVVRQLDHGIRSAEAAGLDVSYQRVAYHIARMAAIRCRIKALTEEQKREMLDFVHARCSEALTELKGIVSGQAEPLRVPNPDLIGLKVRDRSLVTRDGEPVLLIEPMRGLDVNSTRGITNITRKYVYPNWTGASGANILAEEFNKAIYVSAYVVCQPSEKHPRYPEVTTYLEHLRGVAREIDDAFANVPSPWTFTINLLNYESGGHFSYCDESLAHFAAWLEAHYGEIENLNFTWDTQHRSFAEAQPPRWSKGDKNITPNNRAAWYDWLQFSTEYNTSFYQDIRDIFDEELQHLRVPINVVDCGQLMYPCRAGIICYDWDAMVSVNDISIVEGFPRHPRTIQPFAIDPAVTFQVDLQVSLQRDDQTVINMEHHCATPGSGRYATDNYYACALLREALHGASCVSLWSGFHPWGDSIYHGEPVEGYFASIYQRAIKGKGLPGIYKYYKAILDCRRLAREIVRFRSAPTDTALLYSYTTLRQIPPGRIRDNSWSEHEKSFRRFYKAMNPLGDRVHVLTEQQIADGKCDNYRMVIVPSVSHLSVPLARTLEQYAQDGGTLVVAPGPLLFDEHHKHIPYLRSLFGLHLTGWQILGGHQIPFAELAADPDSIEDLGETYRARVATEAVTPTGGWLDGRPELLTDGGLVEVFEPGTDDCQTLLVSDQGLPVLYRVKHGRGQVYYITVPLTWSSYLRVLERIREACGITTAVRIENEAGEIPVAIEMRCVRDDDAIVLYVINLMESPIEDLRIRVSGDYSRFFDLISNEPTSDRLSLDRLETKLIRIDR